MVHCAGILLTGGASSRFGRDKATSPFGGGTLAGRAATVLGASTDPAVEVGPGVSGLPHLDDARRGPLVAFATGLAALDAVEGVILLACDLPLVSAGLVRWLVDHPSPGSVVPVAGGRPQPLCARWAGSALHAAAGLVAEGERSLRPLLELPAVWLAPEEAWVPHAGPRGAATLDDADTPEDLARLAGLIEGDRR